MDLTLTRALARNWWAVALRGALAVIVGILFLWNPIESIYSLVLVIAAFALVDGIFAIIGSFRATGETRTPMIIEGIVGIVAGLFVFYVAQSTPGLTLISVVYVVGAWAIVTGVFEIIAAIRVRDEIENEWWLIIGGIASVIFGILIVAQPLIGLGTIGFLIGIYALIFGVALIFFSFRLKGLSGA